MCITCPKPTSCLRRIRQKQSQELAKDGAFRPKPSPQPVPGWGIPSMSTTPIGAAGPSSSCWAQQLVRKLLIRCTEQYQKKRFLDQVDDVTQRWVEGTGDRRSNRHRHAPPAQPPPPRSAYLRCSRHTTAPVPPRSGYLRCSYIYVILLRRAARVHICATAVSLFFTFSLSLSCSHQPVTSNHERCLCQIACVWMTCLMKTERARSV